MNWLLLLALATGSATFSFLLGWTLSHALARGDVGPGTTRRTALPPREGTWRYSR